MQIIRAQTMGMCFGVRAAIKLALELEQPHDAAIHGQLVHNEEVNAALRDRGFELSGEATRSELSARPAVLVTAHGISHREHTRLLEAGKQVIDTTCPLVRRIHDTAQLLQRQGYFVIIIGKRGHVEVEGLTGDLDDYAVIESPAEVVTYAAARLGVVCQSTTSPLTAEEVVAEIAVRNPGSELRFVPTICAPTLERQRAALELLEQVDALVVVGGLESNNSRQLARLAELRGIPCRFIQQPGQLAPGWFVGRMRVGLTAGTSTPDASIEAVHARLLEIAAELDATQRATA